MAVAPSHMGGGCAAAASLQAPGSRLLSVSITRRGQLLTSLPPAALQPPYALAAEQLGTILSNNYSSGGVVTVCSVGICCVCRLIMVISRPGVNYSAINTSKFQ